MLDFFETAKIYTIYKILKLEDKDTILKLFDFVFSFKKQLNT